jgi:hypothetical protein
MEVKIVNEKVKRNVLLTCFIQNGIYNCEEITVDRMRTKSVNQPMPLVAHLIIAALLALLFNHHSIHQKQRQLDRINTTAQNQ